ncbi:2-oxoacid:acceptor oxidoreductase family protein [uncultured Corynebacterium sp.]|uniref:2-oxoacid:acceptor oxidoreductase family protein n=1 Tax=uncultured Corynebacterium sp. TaxID=159447 RepID=UPI0026298BA9|nr:2-oxoacid:acceptor oxidoreductase family protein [uncultured Corynebacterium sp.]
MVEVRIHGRGGQGVVTASDLIAMAAFAEGRHAQAFPSFGSERTGAPVVAYCRISDREIRTREPVLNPDLLIIQDPTLLPILDVFAGLSDEGYVLINSSKRTAELGLSELQARQPAGHFMTIPATDIAREYTGRTVPNAVLLGGMAALTGLIEMQSVADSIMQRFSKTVGEKNVAAAQAAYELVNEKKAAAQNPVAQNPAAQDSAQEK